MAEKLEQFEIDRIIERENRRRERKFMDKELVKKMEDRLYRYYKQLKIIEKLKNKVVLLYKHQEKIQKEMKDLKSLNIDVELNMGIDYSRDKIQSSGDGSSAAEKETLRYIGNLEKEYRYTVRKMLKTNARIREIELQIDNMRYNLSILSEDNKRLLEWRYGEDKPLEWIADKMYQGAKTTAFRKINELLDNIIQWDGFV